MHWYQSQFLSHKKENQTHTHAKQQIVLILIDDGGSWLCDGGGAGL